MPDSSVGQNAAAEPWSRFPFTLRTMFAVMMTVAFAVGLFIQYYPGFPSLFFALLVVFAGRCILRGNRSGAVGYLAVFAATWLALQFFGPYTNLRNRVVWGVGTERLQQWAVQVLDNPPPADEDGRIKLERDELPEDIRRVAGHYNVVILSYDASQDHLFFSMTRLKG